MNGIYQLLLCADDVILLRDKINTIRHCLMLGVCSLKLKYRMKQSITEHLFTLELINILERLAIKDPVTCQRNFNFNLFTFYKFKTC